MTKPADDSKHELRCDNDGLVELVLLRAKIEDEGGLTAVLTVGLKPQAIPESKPAPESEPASLAAYCARIGADRRAFRRYVIREPDASGYHHDKHLISIASDGEIKIRNGLGKVPDDKDPLWPSEAEKAVIKAEVMVAMAGGRWPKSIIATVPLVEKLRSQIGRTGELFVFLSESGKEVLFVQERGVGKDGNKVDRPWSYWSDGKWRPMEPDHLDQGLPLFGLEQLKDATRVFIHEGAKGAHYVQAMVGTRKDFQEEKLLEANPHLASCPWKEELALPGSVHLGWPGGAPNSWRVDWSPIADLPPSVEVIVVCDHDELGEDAATAISRRLKRSMGLVRFDDRFPEKFDLADAWPRVEAWWRGLRYTGPSLSQMLWPATWATDVLPNPSSKGAPVILARRDFTKEWICVKEPAAFIHRGYCEKLYRPDQFNAALRPFSDAEDTARLLVRILSSQVDGVCYTPTKKKAARRAEIINVDGYRMVNTFRPSNIVPVAGDPSMWLAFMEHLIPGEKDRLVVLRWCATLIVHPEIKMFFALLLISAMQGIGKTTLGDGVLAPLLGRWNVAFVDEHQLLNPAFTSWKAHKRLVICPEIYSGQSRAAYDTLKSTITDAQVTVKRKYLEDYEIENYVHILANSNSMQALLIDPNDRRWFIPRVTESKKPEKYWRDLYAWLNGGGHSIIAHWAEGFLEKEGPIVSGEAAPMSERKAEVISEGRSEGARMAFDLGRLAMNERETRKIVIAVDDVRVWIAGQRKLELSDHRLEKSLTLRKVLRDAGMMEPEGKPDAERVRRFQIKAGENKSHILANFLIAPGEEWPNLKDFYKLPGDLLRM
jgi:hypothetical protein